MNGKGFSCGLCAAVALVCASLAFAEEVAPARSARVGPGTDPRAPGTADDGWIEYIARFVGHGVLDVIPYLIMGN